MRKSAEIEAEIREVKDRQAKLLDDRGDSHREWLSLDQERGDAILDGDESTLQEVNRKLQSVSKQRDDLQAGITAANFRIERFEEELQEAQRAEAVHLDQLAELRYREGGREFDLVMVKAQEERARMASEIDHYLRVWQAARGKVNGATPIQEARGTIEDADARIAQLKSTVGRINKTDKRALERLDNKIIKGEEARAAAKRRLELQEELEGTKRALVHNQQEHDDLAALPNDSAFAKEQRLTKNAEARKAQEQEKARVEAELESIKAS